MTQTSHAARLTAAQTAVGPENFAAMTADERIAAVRATRPTYGVRKQRDGRWYVVNETTGEREPGLSHPNRESAQADADA